MRTIYVLKEELPPVCADCEERKRCEAAGFGAACCDECDHLLMRFDEVEIN